MKKIKFVERTVFNQYGVDHPDNPVFEADSEHTLRNDQADRWLKRERAVLIEDLGPDELETADPEQVAVIEQAIEVRDGAQFESLADMLARSRNELTNLLNTGANLT